MHQSPSTTGLVRPRQPLDDDPALNPVAAPAREFPVLPAFAEHAVIRARAWLVRHSVTVLRISLGVVFLAFGALKFVPGASPAEALAVRTIDTLTLGVVSGGAALLLTAVIETFIGLTLLTGRLLRTGLAVLGVALVGIMAPLVLFVGDLFPTGTPTLEAQYVLKDIVLAAAALVVATKALGARFVAPSH